MTERAQLIMNAFTADWQDEPIEQDKKCLANALRAVAEEVYFKADVELLNEIADELEAL